MCVWLDNVDYLFFKSSSEDILVFLLVFLCLGHVDKDSTLY